MRVLRIASEFGHRNTGQDTAHNLVRTRELRLLRVLFVQQLPDGVQEIDVRLVRVASYESGVGGRTLTEVRIVTS